MYIDMAYTVDMVRTRAHESCFESRHSGSYFQRIWGLHPLADRVAPGRAKKVEFIQFSARQVVIEASAELLRLPKWLLPLNFMLSQCELVRQMVALVKRERITWIVSTDPLYSGLFAWALSRLCRKPFCVWVIANYDDLYEATGLVAMPKLVPFRALEKLLIRFVFSRANLVAPASGTLRDYCLRNGALPARTEIFPVARNLSPVHMVPPDQRDPADEVFSRLKIPLGRRYLLVVSRLEPVKHVDHALKAMAVIARAYPDTLCIFAGEGSLREKLLAETRALHLEDNVAFPGLIEQASLSRIIPQAVTLSPLTGMALNECALGASPIVAYDRDSQVRLMVRNEESGFLVPFLDHEAMATAAIRILGDAALRRRLAEGARRIALQHSELGEIFRHEGETFERFFSRM